MDLPKRIIKRLDEFENFECFEKHKKEIIRNLIDIIRLRKNQLALINKCYEDYFLNLDYKITYDFRINIHYESKELDRLIADFKNILSLITAIDLFDDKDLLFVKLFDILNEKIDSELNRKNKILLDNKKFWEELKKDIQEYWTNTKYDIDKYKNKISIYKFQLETRIKKINEFNPY